MRVLFSLSRTLFGENYLQLLLVFQEKGIRFHAGPSSRTAISDSSAIASM